MNVLFVTSFDPFDSTTGACLRTHFLLNAIQKIADVYVLHLNWEEERKVNEKYVKAIYFRGNTSFCEKLSHKFRYLFEKYLHITPLWFTKQKLERPLSEYFIGIKFDFIVSRYIQPASSLQLWDQCIPVLIDIDDHPLQVFDTYESRKLNPFIRGIARYIIEKQVKFLFNKCQGGWIANRNQADCQNILFPIFPLPNITAMPENYHPDSSRENYIITIGWFYHYPNVEGVMYFLESIWPKFHSKYPSISYKIAGKDAPEELLSRINATDGVEYLGFVCDLNSLYEKSLASVVPILSGSGTCIKVLESLAYQRVVIASEFGIRGIETEHNGIFVFEDDISFCRCFEDAVLDSTVRGVHETNAATFIKENYSVLEFDENVKKLFQIFY